MEQIRIVVASPSDVTEEWSRLELVVDELNRDPSWASQFVCRTFRWETDCYPGFNAHGPQGVIDRLAKISESDIVVVIFWKRFGTPVSDADSGTEHEFKLAYESWKSKGRPQIMAYFKNKPIRPEMTEDAINQLEQVNRFRESFPEEGLSFSFDDELDFERKFREQIRKQLIEVTQARDSSPGLTAKSSENLLFKQIDLEPERVQELALTARKDVYTSFHTLPDGDIFMRVKVATTDGYVDFSGGSKLVKSESSDLRCVKNYVYLVRDPIRPFEIQIGEQRSRRHRGTPDAVPFVEDLTPDVLRSMYPFIADDKHRWLRMVFAELASSEDVLRYLYDNDEDPYVRNIAARNPSASNNIKQQECPFCEPEFFSKRQTTSYGGAKIFANDFPYGPFFHYVVLPEDPIHSWSDIHLKHVEEMNLAIWKHLNKRENLKGSSGVRIGLNSSVRHLVLGKTTRSSAGATITHVHKQVWGMMPAAVNLGDNLDTICREFRKRQGIDYLGRYLRALKEAGFIIWEDDQVALYVPFGQISVHEVQIMVKRKGTCAYIELSEQEVKSLSKAEFIAILIYRFLNINSFNEVMLSTPFEHDTDDNFRLINTFITREVDIAASELNLLYVVDRHPTDTVAEIRKYKINVERECGEQISL